MHQAPWRHWSNRREREPPDFNPSLLRAVSRSDVKKRQENTLNCELYAKEFEARNVWWWSTRHHRTYQTQMYLSLAHQISRICQTPILIRRETSEYANLADRRSDEGNIGTNLGWGPLLRMANTSPYGLRSTTFPFTFHHLNRYSIAVEISIVQLHPGSVHTYYPRTPRCRSTYPL